MTDPDPDVELLADLDAGLLDAERAAAVRAAALADPRSAAVLDALAATRADLGSLPPPPVPPEFAARWSAALEEAAVDEQASRVRPFPVRRRRVALALAAAAAVVALVGGGVLVASGRVDPRVTLAVTGPDLAAIGLAAVGRFDFGPLDDDARRAGCLARFGAVEDAAGGLPVRYRDTPGVLLVLTTGEGRGRFRILVVDDACSRALADVTAG